MLEILLVLGPGGVGGIPEGAVKYAAKHTQCAEHIYSVIISGGPPVAKASNENGSDGQERKLGEQNGLDIDCFVIDKFFIDFADKNYNKKK